MTLQGAMSVALLGLLALLVPLAAAGDIVEAPSRASLLDSRLRPLKALHREAHRRHDDDDDVAEPSYVNFHGRRTRTGEDDERRFHSSEGRLRAHAREEPEEEEPDKAEEEKKGSSSKAEEKEDDEEHEKKEKDHDEDHDEDEDDDFDKDEERMKSDLADLEAPSPAAAGPAAALTPEQEQQMLREQIHQAEAIQHLAKDIDILDGKVKNVRKDLGKVKKQMSAAAGKNGKSWVIWFAAVFPWTYSLLFGSAEKK